MPTADAGARAHAVAATARANRRIAGTGSSSAWSGGRPLAALRALNTTAAARDHHPDAWDDRGPHRRDEERAMCRNIRTLHNFEPPATPDEVQAAALQYVRKISGSTRPSKANQEAFDRAVEAVTAISRTLLD